MHEGNPIFLYSLWQTRRHEVRRGWGGVCQWGRGGDFIPFDVYVVLTVARASQISSPANCGPNVVRGSKIFKKTRNFKFHVKFLSV